MVTFPNPAKIDLLHAPHIAVELHAKDATRADVEWWAVDDHLWTPGWADASVQPNDTALIVRQKNFRCSNFGDELFHLEMRGIPKAIKAGRTAR